MKTLELGDQVWVSDFIVEKEREDCVECGGRGVWLVTTVNVAFEVPCAVCSGPWHERRGWRVKTVYTPRPWLGTVEQINSTATPKGTETTVMLRETGVGSGTLWAEERLYLTEADALRGAEALIEERLQQEAEREAHARERRMKEPPGNYYGGRDRFQRILDHIAGSSSQAQKLAVIRRIAQGGVGR